MATPFSLPRDVHDRILVDLQTQFRELFPHVPLILERNHGLAPGSVMEEVLDEGMVGTTGSTRSDAVTGIHLSFQVTAAETQDDVDMTSLNTLPEIAVVKTQDDVDMTSLPEVVPDDVPRESEAAAEEKEEAVEEKEETVEEKEETVEEKEETVEEKEETEEEKEETEEEKEEIQQLHQMDLMAKEEDKDDMVQGVTQDDVLATHETTHETQTSSTNAAFKTDMNIEFASSASSSDDLSDSDDGGDYAPTSGECEKGHMSGGCQLLSHANQVRFLCASFPGWRNSLVTSPLSMTKKKLRTGVSSLRTSIKVMCGITGAPLIKPVVIRGPVYHVQDSVDMEHAKATVHDHAVAILFRTYVRVVSAVRTFAVSKSLLHDNYAELEFDKTPPQQRVVVPSIPLLPGNARVQLAGNYKMKVHALKAEQELVPSVKVVSALKKAAVESRCFPASAKGCSVCSCVSTPHQFGCRVHAACSFCINAWAHVMQVWQQTQRRPCPSCMEVGAPSPPKRQRLFEPSSSDDGIQFSVDSSDDANES